MEPKPNYIVTSRPEGMSFEVYKAILKQQKKALKEYKKGTWVKINPPKS